MPKLGSGLDYFDIQTDIASDKRIKLLRAEFGIKGFGIWIELIRQIYADEGYFMEWNDDTKLLFASDVGESGGLVDEVVKGSVKRGLFDKSVFDQFDVLTSKHIQKKYLNAIKRRTTDQDIDGRYLVIPVYSDIISGNDNIKLVNVNIKKQRREEKSKEENKYVCGTSKNWDGEQPIDYASFVNMFNTIYDCNLRVTDKKRENIRARLRMFSGAEISEAWFNRKEDEWLTSDGIEYLDNWKAAMRNDEKVEKYLNANGNTVGTDGYDAYR